MPKFFISFSISMSSRSELTEATLPTWLGFGFATGLSFDFGSRLLWLGSCVFAAFADSFPGATGHKQSRGWLSAWTQKQRGISPNFLEF